MHITCPRCASNDVRPSRSQNRRLPPMVRWLMTVMRCHTCLKTYIRWGRWGRSEAEPPGA